MNTYILRNIYSVLFNVKETKKKISQHGFIIDFNVFKKCPFNIISRIKKSIV